MKLDKIYSRVLVTRTLHSDENKTGKYIEMALRIVFAEFGLLEHIKKLVIVSVRGKNLLAVSKNYKSYTVLHISSKTLTIIHLKRCIIIIK